MNPAVLLFIVRLLLALVLYAILGSLLFLMWQDLRRGPPGSDGVPAAHLAVVGGAGAGRTYRLEPVTRIGRAADNGVHLEDVTVSAYHAQITYREGHWWLEDLGSRNGTAVNDLPVETPVVLTYGDRIRVGGVWLALESGVGESWEGQTRPSGAGG
jgi:hypothetical protein